MARGQTQNVKRPAALIVTLVFLSAQPTYVCALRCMLGHGHGGASAHAVHMHDSAPDTPDCHGAHLTDGALGVLTAPSPAVVSTVLAVVPAAPVATASPLEASRHTPRGVLLVPEPPPPRL